MFFRNYPGCYQSVWEPAYLWKWDHQCLQWAEHGRHGPPHICSSRGSLQTDGQVLKLCIVTFKLVQFPVFCGDALYSPVCRFMFLLQRWKEPVYHSERWVWSWQNCLCKICYAFLCHSQQLLGWDQCWGQSSCFQPHHGGNIHLCCKVKDYY